HPGARQRVLRHEARLGIFLVEILDDRERLREARAVVELKSGKQRLRVDFPVWRGPVLARGKVHELRLVLQPLQVQRDAHAERRRAAKVCVELQSAGAILTFSSPTESIPACSSSPGLTGPTPAGVPVKMRSPGSS